jgi:hypothetical protein
MSRSTQYIGLTKDAEDFVKNLKLVPSSNKTEGMFGEEVLLGKWEDQFNIYEEEVVATPWSNGLMIFTALRTRSKNYAEGSEKDEGSIYFNWVINPTIENEYDEERGHYYV